MQSILKANATAPGLKAMYKPPFGYDVTQNGNLIPITTDLELLQEMHEALEMKAISLRDAALYLSYKGSRTISHEGLRKRLRSPVELENGAD